MDLFFERHKLPKFTKGEIDSMNNSLPNKEIKSIMNTLPKKKTQIKYLRNVQLTLPEKAMVTHSSILAWRIPWTGEPGRLQSMGSRRVRHDCMTSLSLFTFTHWRRKQQPTPVFLPAEYQGQWNLVTQSQTRLKWLSSLAAVNSTNLRMIHNLYLKIEAGVFQIILWG